MTTTWSEWVHEAADIFPMMPDAELKVLGNDIVAHGLKHPLVFLGNKLIDGRNRLKAVELVSTDDQCEQLIELMLVGGFDENGVEYPAPKEFGADVDPFIYVLSVNFHRRHLTADDRDKAIRDLKAKRPELSIRAIAEATRTPKSTVARTLATSTVPVGTVGRVTGRNGKSYPATRKRAAAAPALLSTENTQLAERAMHAAEAKGTDYKPVVDAILRIASAPNIKAAASAVFEADPDKAVAFAEAIFAAKARTEAAAALDRRGGPNLGPE